MAYEPRRVQANRVPLDLYSHRSFANPGTFDVTTEDGQVVASNVPDFNCARLFVAAPMLLRALYEAQWWIRDQVERNHESFEIQANDHAPEVDETEEPDAQQGLREGRAPRLDPRVTDLMELIDLAVSAGCTPSGLYPVDD